MDGYPTLIGRVHRKDMGRNAPLFLDLWMFLNLISNTILLPLLVMIFLFSKRARKPLPLINVCITWILSGVFSILLFYVGGDKGDAKVSQELCITQSSLLYGIMPMWSVAIFVLFYYHMVFVFSPGRCDGKVYKMIMILSAPYIAEVVFVVVSLIISLHDPSKVSRGRRFFYCSLDNKPLDYTKDIFTIVMCTAISYIEVRLFIEVSKSWTGLHKAGRKCEVETRLLMRVLAFGLYVMFGMIGDIMSMFDQHSALPDMYAASGGTVVLLVFGTTREVFQTLCFWRTYPPVVVHPPPTSDWRIDSVSGCPDAHEREAKV